MPGDDGGTIVRHLSRRVVARIVEAREFTLD
jgi:hypothetical protein